MGVFGQPKSVVFMPQLFGFVGLVKMGFVVCVTAISPFNFAVSPPNISMFTSQYVRHHGFVVASDLRFG